MMPRGKRDPVLLSHAELSGTDGEGPRSGGEGRRSTSEEEEEEEGGHLPGLPRDELAKSMSGSSVSSYHSALCSEGTETFKDCLEFLDEEGTASQDAGQRGSRPEGAAPGRWAPVGAPAVPPRQAQLSGTAKNSPAPGQGGRMGPLGGDRQLVSAATPSSRELAGPRQPGGMLSGVPSDSDEADGEVRALTARAFRSLSGLPGTHLDMCSSHTSSSLSNSLSEDGGRPRQWPAAGSEARGTAAAPRGRVGWPFPAGVEGELLGLLGKEQFECVDVELESGEARKGHSKKRTVPKRQIQLKRKERKETGFGPWGDGQAPQPLPPARKEPPSKGRGIGEDFRLNYKQFMKMASLDANEKTRAASCLVKNVLAKKMQYEQRIKMEQKGLRGSSTSSGPSSAGTDLPGDGLEGKSSSLSRSDCSFSAEDLRGGGMPAATGDVPTTRPAKGVVLSEATRESVCKLKKTFNELNERMKYQEVLEGHHRLPGTTEKPASERICYRQARALFEAHPEVGKGLDVAPRFQRGPRPWPSLKQRAIRPSRPQTLPLEPNSLPAAPRLFTSRAQEVKLLPQSRREEKPPPAPHPPPSPLAPKRGSPPPAAPPKTDDKGKGRIPQPRDVRKLVKSSYSLCFGTTGASQGPAAPATPGDPAPAAPLVIHCTSVCRRGTGSRPGDREARAAPSPEPAPARTEGPAEPTSTQPTRSSPSHIPRAQPTRSTSEGAAAPSAPRQERSELRLAPRVAQGVPHMETHLHVLVGQRPPAVAEEGPPAQSRAVLRTEKTLLLPPPPPPSPSPTEGEDGGGRGGSRGLPAAEGLQAGGQQRGGSDGRDPHAGSPAHSSVYPQPGKEAERREQVVGNTSSAGSTGPTAPFPARVASKGPSVQLPEQREAWERFPPWPAAPEPHLPASPAENSNYLAIPVKAPETSLMPKLPSVSNPATAFFGTPLVPNPASTSFGTPTVTNPASTSLGTPLVPNPARASFGTPVVPAPVSTSFGTPAVPNMTNSSLGYSSASSLVSTSFGAPLVSSPTNKSFGTPLIPYPASASFGTPLASNPSSAPFGTPLIPNPSIVPFGNPLSPNPSRESLGTPLVPNPSITSFGTPLIPNPPSTSFGTPLVPSPPSTSFGTSLVNNPSSASFGTPLVPSPPSTSFGTSLVNNPSSASFGTPLAPNPSSASFGTPLIPNPSIPSFGTPLAPNPSSASFGTPLIPNPSIPSFGTPLAPNPSSVSFGTPLIPNPSIPSFGTPLAPNPSSVSFGTPLIPNPSIPSFGTPLAPNPSSASFGTPLIPNPSIPSFGTPLAPDTPRASFGIPLVPNPSIASFGTPLIPNPPSTSFGTPLVPHPANSSLGIPTVLNPASSSFGSPLVTNPVPASLGHPSVSNMASSSFGSPLLPNLAGAPQGTGVCPLVSREVAWRKPSPDLPQRPEGLVPPAQPQPHPEDAPPFPRRTDGASPSSKNTPSSTKPFAPHLPTHRRMLVDPDSGKCYYMEPPRQPQLKTLYDPETGQYLEVLIPPVASHPGLYQAPFNPLLMASGVYAPPYAPYSGFPGLPPPPQHAGPSPAHPEPPAAENPGFSGTFSPAPTGEGTPAAGGPDCGYLESPYYIPTGMQTSPRQPRASPAGAEKGPQLPM
ncbi:proline-rich basic protein 1 [Apus apus]|uniref:proline-rich basic protein 1 n=1 Tax=Apus apus TaxID=8895 RepID=UPI0021F8676A|nr:proline-rich basic protein 1 [Apus apus]